VPGRVAAVLADDAHRSCWSWTDSRRDAVRRAKQLRLL
jgi:hypothetical protein